MAPPKPSKQTQILLDEMNHSQDNEKSRWDQVMDQFVLLFTRMNDIGEIQQDMKKQLKDTSTKVDKCTAEQNFIAQQVRANGQVVAQLTIRQFEAEDRSDSDGLDLVLFDEEENPFSHAYVKDKGPSKTTFSKNHKPKPDPHKSDHLPHRTLPKMPKFDDTHPKIWIDKCLNYFEIYSIPAHLWVQAASMHLEENATKWWQAHKINHKKTSWQKFYDTIQEEFVYCIDIYLYMPVIFCTCELSQQNFAPFC